QTEGSSDPWTAGEIALCFRDRATVRRSSNRWKEALEDLSHCERAAMRLPLLSQRMILSNIYNVRALLLSTPYSDVYNPKQAAESIAVLRKYPGPSWVADSTEAQIAFLEREWQKAAALYLAVAESLEHEGWVQGVASCRSRAAECFFEFSDLSAAER